MFGEFIYMTPGYGILAVRVLEMREGRVPTAKIPFPGVIYMKHAGINCILICKTAPGGPGIPHTNTWRALLTEARSPLTKTRREAFAERR